MSARVPRTIHYCWFSDEPLTPLLRRCVDSWRKAMPEYRLRLWDAKSFDFESIPFVQDAIRLRKWAFAADYVRLHALWTEGGIYLDSDVRVYKPFDRFLNHGFFTSHEAHPFNRTVIELGKVDENGRLRDSKDFVRWLSVQAAIMGSEPGHPFVGKCLDFYADKRLPMDAGQNALGGFVIGPHISKVAESFGYRYCLDEQHLRDHMVIYGPEVFVGNSHYLTPESYALHLCNNSWHERAGQRRVLHAIRNRYPMLAPAVGLWEKAGRGVAKLFG